MSFIFKDLPKKLNPNIVYKPIKYRPPTPGTNAKIKNENNSIATTIGITGNDEINYKSIAIIILASAGIVFYIKRKLK